MAINRIFIAGAGRMGQGIAEAAATAGIIVDISDIDSTRLEQGMAGIESSLDRAIERWVLTEGEKRIILSRIKPAKDIQSVTDPDFAIEAVPENLDLKRSVFASFDEHFGKRTILVTSTSTLTITDLARATGRPDKVVGMHFLFPVPHAAMVEVSGALKTSEETLRAAKSLAARMKKRVIELHEYPGFVTTRVMIPFINEAAYAVMEGVANAADVDEAIKLGFGFPMGPLELADMIGLDDLMILMESLFRELGDFKYKPCPKIRRLVRAGHLGKKTGRGFLRYDSGEGELR
ncbi:MAG: 3-hydroxyacyl-CoA dehydrogenase NAD-binding domain-containing protein [bacterium]|jgi:3-hydroxybutyryl-CoA dehydrogenase